MRYFFYYILKDLVLEYQIILLKDLKPSFFPTQRFEIKVAHFTTEGF